MRTHNTVIIFYPVQIGSRSSGWQNWFPDITIWSDTFWINRSPKRFLQLHQCLHCRLTLFFYHYASIFLSVFGDFFISLLSCCAQLELPHLSQLPCCALCQPPLCLVGWLPASCQSARPDMSHKVWAVNHFTHTRTFYPNFIIVVLIPDNLLSQLNVRAFSHCHSRIQEVRLCT